MQSLFRSRSEESAAPLRGIQEKFRDFRKVLDRNNHVLKVVSDMEEKSQGEYLLDMSYVHGSLAEIRAGVQEMIEALVSLGGDQYAPLRDRCAAIDRQIAGILPGTRPIERDDLTIPFQDLRGDRAFSVGGKSAQLGEMMSLGLPVPDGFAISAWAYKRFMDANDLQSRISERLASVDIKDYEGLAQVSGEIREMVASGTVPEDLAEAIGSAQVALAGRAGAARFALRSSAIGEDTQFSFAGQYESFLNVTAEALVERYRQVLASKFSPKAIYYFLSHDLTESELAMGVGCMVMVDAAVSGVTYSRDPVSPESDHVLVNAVLGLGKYLVDGTLTPDTFRVSRSSGAVIESAVAAKPVRLTLDGGGGTREEAVPEEMRTAPSLSPEQLKELAAIAQRLEAHYGQPQDIEWSVDTSGRLFLLQSRPLRVLSPKAEAAEPDVSRLEVLLSGGTTVCPGAGGGVVFHASSSADLGGVPEGAVLVAPHPFPGLITVMDRLSALVVETGGVASHMATIAREYRLPALAGLRGVMTLSAGSPVTVDATGATIYAGVDRALIEARRPEYELFEDVDIFKVLGAVLAHVSPLNLLDPGAPDFAPEGCRTFHDITRFAHQRAMEEMFSAGRAMQDKGRLGQRLKSEIPLPVQLITIDEDATGVGRKRDVPDDAIGSAPMQAFWDGVKAQGWPTPIRGARAKDFMSVLATTMTRPSTSEMSELSFALVGREYMLLSLNLGYHFTTVEAMCSGEVSKNYVRFQNKEGGAGLDRRIRRVKLITDVLGRMGFEPSSKADFIDATLSYQPAEALFDKLRLLGRVTMLTKQLDMALSNDAITEWYTKDMLEKLGLGETGGTTP
ncbi:MAG: hypothetical protein JXQ73_26655 [Phycisphaerae bacterium]|nr:hypothetical protein [Phycisphaerae bacterium]